MWRHFPPFSSICQNCSSQRALQWRPSVTLSKIRQHLFKSVGRLFRYLYPPWSPTPGLMIDYCPLKDTHFFLIELLQQKLLVVNKIVKLLNYPAVNNSIVEGDNSIISIIKYSSYSIIRKILMTLDFNRKIYCTVAGSIHRGTTQSRSYSWYLAFYADTLWKKYVCSMFVSI